jgi:3-methyladenine DNA glycosylase AlkD
MMFTILNDIRESLKNNADPQILASSARYHKEGEAPKVYGVGMANVGKIAKEAFKQIKHLPKQEIFELCEGLWQTGYLEESVVACVWAESLHKQYEPADFKIFERS